MKEQSHKDEMSAALRGDFARLRDRGVSATLLPHDAAATASAEPDAPSDASRDGERAPEADTDLVPDAPDDGEREPQQEPERGGWLSRLVGR